MTEEEIQEEAKRNSLSDAIYVSLGLIGILLAIYCIFHFAIQSL
jgi:hypothetical protein